jgi:N-acetylglucosamine-6-phosphate deacetylase
MQADAAGFAEVERFLASKGVGHYLPTTVTAPLDETLRALERIGKAIESSDSNGREGRATPIGIHLEGPFISHIKRGVHPQDDILLPDIGLFDRFQEAAHGHIRLITAAPEVPGAMELIEHATRRGVRVSMGHSNALAAEANAAIAKGASSATHTFNAMQAVEIVLRCKGLDRAILVTDGMSATGMPDGTYTLGNFEVEVCDGRATARGVLAGSVLTLDQAVANFARFTKTPFAEVTRAVTRNPAALLGLNDRFVVAPGQPANFNRFAADGTLIETTLQGLPILA